MKRGIGELWHRRITRTAGANPHAAVRLEDVSRAVQMMFRAGGGDARVRVVPATPQRIGGPRASLGALDGETLALPPVLAVFDQPVLNRDLYLWLAALGACHDGESADWIGANLRATRRALARFPGLRARYRRLAEAHLAQRPEPRRLKPAAAAAEHAIRQALRATLDGEDGDARPGPGLQPDAAAPVWLWLGQALPEGAGDPAEAPFRAPVDRQAHALARVVARWTAAAR
ncbi:hypothetical protein [Ottowia sp.]|jgi:nitric oxide reductase NorD protein|uniref:hypothetical protein n=1 Tax=Ottowia sp. TaxID=1898956 RepID=UPI0025F666A6|nr:hypothetical protein [Ottowia sp.]MBK6612856.1 hypothetical protein [Ottowia sp.]MBK6748010.1 hypothetical protein [Ottowia sp.]